MYAVVAPGFSSVYTNWSDVERIKSLYPYPKWIKCRSEVEAREWIKRNSYGNSIHDLYNYGNTFKDMFIDAKYKIAPDCVYYVLDCKRVGNLRIVVDDAIVEYKGSKIFIKLPDIYLSDESIAGHMSAIHNLLNIVGPFVDINIQVPYYAIYYCLTVYSKGNNRYVTMVRNLMDSRICEVAISLKMTNIRKEEL